MGAQHSSLRGKANVGSPQEVSLAVQCVAGIEFSAPDNAPTQSRSPEKAEERASIAWFDRPLRAIGRTATRFCRGRARGTPECPTGCLLVSATGFDPLHRAL